MVSFSTPFWSESTMVSAVALDPEPVSPQRRQVGAAGEEGNVVPAAREQRAEEAADRARARDQDPTQKVTDGTCCASSGASK